MIGVDSTFIIDYLNGNAHAVKSAQGIEEPLAITPITIFEVFLGFFLKQRTEQEQRIAQEFLDTLELLDITTASAIRAAEMQSELLRKGEKAQTTDLLIAATYITHSCTRVITRDKDFAKLGIPILRY